MPTTVSVFLVGLLAGALLVVAGRSRGRRHLDDSPTIADPAAAEHWLVDRVTHRPRLRRILIAGDRRFVGGATVGIAFVVIFLAAVVVGAAFDAVDTNRGLARWDDSIARWGPDHASEASIAVLRVVTELGATWVLLGLMTVVGLADWWRTRQGGRGSFGALAFLLTVGIGVGLINNGLKLVVMRERPPSALTGAAGSSFPSGHSAAAAACWLAIALVVGRWASRSARRWIAGAAVAIAFLVAATRALLGVHWLTDVVAGVVVGWAWFFLVALAFGGRHQRLGEPLEEIADEAPHPEFETARDDRRVQCNDR